MEQIVFFILAISISFIIKEARKPTPQKRINNRPDEFAEQIEDSIQRLTRSRKGYYREIYLKSDAWKRKRFVVLKRDNWKCVHCGQKATQVHHKRYAQKNIGKEPIEWLESVCKSCHERLHS